MFKNYFKIAWRNILHQKLYSSINIIGLGIASAFCILFYGYFQNERSFDNFHKNENQLYRLEFNNVFDFGKTEKHSFFSPFLKNSEQRNLIQTPPVLSVELENNFPEIERAIRIQPGYDVTIRVNNRSFKEKNNSAFVDNDFFQVFNFPLIEGIPETALEGNNNIVISQRAAIKYFGSANVVGKTLSVKTEQSKLYTVSAVAKNFPTNSSFQFDFIMPRTSQPGYSEEMDRDWHSFSDLLVLQLRKTTNVQSFNKSLTVFCRRHFDAFSESIAPPGTPAEKSNLNVILRRFADAHYNASDGWGHYTDLENIYQLTTLALVILLIACLNYIFLTLTGTVSRSHEVGIRKTIGAQRKQIVAQFYIETQLLAFIAVIVGLSIAIVGLPLFNQLTGAELQWQLLSIGHVVVFLIVLALTLGLLAGIYPALVMSGLKPLNILRKFSTYKLNPNFSRFLVAIQFSVCIVLIISTLVIQQQMTFVNQRNLGFDKSNVITVENPFLFDTTNRSVLLKERLANFASSTASIEDFSCSFLGYNNRNNFLINGQNIKIEAVEVDYNYFSFFHIPIIKGRSFDPLIAGDSAELHLKDDQHMQGASAVRSAIVVNETLYKMLGKPRLNEINPFMGGVIIGVCKDYYSDDLTNKISPLYHKVEAKFIPCFSFRIKAGQKIPDVVAKIRKNWNEMTNHEPFSFTFLDETLAKNYDAYLRWMQTVTVASILAILIACLGLFGLSGLTTVSRIKEIGIRKVLGASVTDLFLLLNKNTLFIAIISFAIAIPVASYLGNQWLQNFAYRIHADWKLFVLGGFISAATAFVAVSYHTIKTARANPVESLRTE